jgi:hypothetical protein
MRQYMILMRLGGRSRPDASRADGSARLKNPVRPPYRSTTVGSICQEHMAPIFPKYVLGAQAELTPLGSGTKRTPGQRWSGVPFLQLKAMIIWAISGR